MAKLGRVFYACLSEEVTSINRKERNIQRDGTVPKDSGLFQVVSKKKIREE